MKMKALSLFLTAALALPIFAQELAPTAEQKTQQKEYDAFMSKLAWQTEGAGLLGSRAEITIPQGFRFLGSGDASKIMKFYGNLTDGSELGFIAPDNLAWFALFEFEDVGYVKDDEKDKLDADAILEELKEGQKMANEQLTELGRPTLEVLGWHTPPFYNTTTKNLEWAIRLVSSDGGEVLNYKTKILGRKGVMNVVLVCDETQLAEVIPQHQALLKGFSYQKEESYASYTKGDKIAEYGLVGLIAGGGLLVAAKSGLLAKLWKPILVGLVAVGAFIKRIIRGKSPDNI
jgi:uncharacterized membrane-anchored protein